MSPEILSANRQKFLQKLYQKKYRYQYKTYICEGYKPLETAIAQKNSFLREIVITKSVLQGKYGDKIKKISSDRAINLYLCDQRIMNKLSDEQTPSNILFTVNMNIPDQASLNHCSANNIVSLEKVSDPGNLGTIIRTAVWFGINSIILGPNCVDPYNPKTVRSSAGAIFYPQIFTDTDLKYVVERFKTKGYHTVATVLKNGEDLKEWKKSEKNIIFFGSESTGISDRLLGHIDTKITIPGSNQIESLNVSVAAGIVFYHLLNSGEKLVKNE
jgi:TrmH family RNA methyltransferase